MPWDSSKWDQSQWRSGPIAPPAQGWGTAWRWWYQGGDRTITELSKMVVEARWTTDSHRLGDGTFRGDLQPGTATVRLWDPDHQLDFLDRYGAIWAYYVPTQACWCWFYDSFTRGLYAQGDPADADAVFVGTPWPDRLKNPQQAPLLPSQSVTARLNAIVGQLNGTTYPLQLPAVSASIATQNQVLPAAKTVALGAYNLSPDFLAQIRDAATDGVAWWTPRGAPSGLGALVLNYARWETAAHRVLDRSQIIAGPATTADLSWYTAIVNWNTTNGANGTTSNYGIPTTGVPVSGWQGPTMRLYGDAAFGTGVEYAAVQATSESLLDDRSDPTEQILSTVDVQSGQRATATGGPATVDWDPYSHVFGPLDVAQITDDWGIQTQYRVIRSDHRLTPRLWQTTHTLEKYTAPVPLT
jgi:hypothetical protein